MIKDGLASAQIPSVLRPHPRLECVVASKPARYARFRGGNVVTLAPMQDRPLSIKSILEHARRVYADSQISAAELRDFLASLVARWWVFERWTFKELKLELAGYRSLRSRRYRIIYRITEEARTVEILYFGVREDVYEAFRRLLGS
jgi:mRNA-degrading endonuclease RelE of RelBE toxin-antitoxin system